MARPSCWKTAILLAFLLIIYSIPVATLFTRKETASSVEKRKLSPFPEIRWNLDSIKNFPAAFNQYFSDHFSFRRSFIHSYNTFKKDILHTTPVYGVVLGKKDWLYYFPPFSMEDLTGRMGVNAFTLDRWRATLENRRDWFARRHIRYYFLLAPNKQTIYPEYLPDWMQQVIAPSSRELLNDYLKNHSHSGLVDPTPDLLKNKALLSKQQQFNYYMRDSHWNSKGAKIGADFVIGKIRLDFPESSIPASPKTRPVLSRRVGDLTTMLDMTDSLQEKLIEYRIISPCAKSLHKPTNLKPPYARWVKAHSCDNGKLSALIIHDSFGHQLNKYLREYFRTTVETNVINYEDMEYLIDRFKPDVVIDERVERSLRDALIPTNLIDGEVYRHILEDEHSQPVLLEGDLDAEASCLNHVQLTRNDSLLGITTDTADAFICISADKPAANESYLLYLDILPALTTNISVSVSSLPDEGTTIPVMQQTVFSSTRNHVYFELPQGMAANLRIHFGSYSNLFSLHAFKLVKFRSHRAPDKPDQ